MLSFWSAPSMQTSPNSFQIHLFMRQRIPIQILFILTQQAPPSLRLCTKRAKILSAGKQARKRRKGAVGGMKSGDPAQMYPPAPPGTGGGAGSLA